MPTVICSKCGRPWMDWEYAACPHCGTANGVSRPRELSADSVERAIREGGGTPLGNATCAFSPSSWRGDSTPTVGGRLHAAVSLDGIRFLAFVGPDDSFQFAAESVAEVRTVGDLVKALEVQIGNDDGSYFVVSFTGPIERIKAMLADCGIWMIF